MNRLFIIIFKLYYRRKNDKPVTSVIYFLRGAKVRYFFETKKNILKYFQPQTKLECKDKALFISVKLFCIFFHFF